ncbi:MAG: HlyD family efflux transporter periplasmic adaptor subunit [Bacteroidota bacterium]
MAAVTKEELFNTRIVFLHQTRISSQIIYCITLSAITFALGALPFLYLTISIKSSGIIKSNFERIELLAPTSGRLLSLNVSDNQKVVKEEILLVIDDTVVKQQKNMLKNYNGSLSMLLQDAEKLIKVVNTKWPSNTINTKTGFYTASWQQYQKQFQNATNTSLQAERIYTRYQTLYQKNVVTKADFEQFKFNYEQAISNQEIVIKTYTSQWEMEANQYRKELGDLQSQKIQLDEQQKQYSLKATVNGSIQSLAGLQEGTFIHANQKIGEISPDGVLFAYCYVKPSDIGVVKKGQSVRFQIDAFNYNQWGMLVGKVIDISDDTIIQNQQPYFKVKCHLDKNYLQLKSDYKGFIKKGMTFTASFTLTKRSLYQLLYDKIDDWIN